MMCELELDLPCAQPERMGSIVPTRIGGFYSYGQLPTVKRVMSRDLVLVVNRLSHVKGMLRHILGHAYLNS